MTRHTENIRFKLPSHIKKDFFDFCKKEGVTPSEVLRRFCELIPSGNDLIAVEDLKGGDDA
jgi:antitoxin component of RelBE/YafQ-DinJ toxin-antitoxin module